MKNNMDITQAFINAAIALGAYKANVIDARDVETDVAFRDMCASNLCGMYGRCWTCPPDIGEIEELIKSLASYSNCLVYQTVGQLEDSFDIEGMQDAADIHNKLSKKLRSYADDLGLSSPLFLGAGGCRICPVCAKRSDQPCKYPHLAMSSLEAYGINVSKLATTAEMKYINGQNTVTYFGAVFF